MQDYQAPADLLKERIIMVTGAGSGIGRAAAKAYAAHGATVILVGRTVSKLESVYDEIEAAGHPKPAIVPLNFEGAAVKEYEELAMTIEDNFDRIDGLLHNAAILGTRSPIELYDPEIWNKVMHVNATAPFLLSRAMIPLLRKSDDASVIFTASGVGRRAKPYWGAYAATKSALETLVKTYGEEVAHTNVKVSLIDPGVVATNMRATAFPGEDQALLTQPEDITEGFVRHAMAERTASHENNNDGNKQQAA